MRINWKVRIKNKAFWVAMVPALVLLVQQIAALCGVTIDLNDFQVKALAIIETAFVLLTILGIVNDPTVATLSDSGQALGYDEPRRD